MDVIFRTSRLYIRPFVTADIDRYYTMVSDVQVMRYIKPALSKQEAIEELQILISNYENSHIYYLWAICLRGSSQLIGLAGIYTNTAKEYEIAYRYMPEGWGNGYGGEICEGLIDHCQSMQEVDRIVAHCNQQNTKSVKILQKYMSKVGEVMGEDKVSYRYELDL